MADPLAAIANARLAYQHYVTDTLESNGLAAFDASWRELGDQLRTALRRRPDGEESGA